MTHYNCLIRPIRLRAISVSAVLLLLSSFLLASCSPSTPQPDPSGKQEGPQLPTGVFTKVGANIEEVRAFEEKQKDHQAVAAIPTKVEPNDIWTSVFYVLLSEDKLAPCNAIAYSGRGERLERVNLFMQTRAAYQEKIAPWLQYYYRPIGYTADNREVYQEKSITTQSPQDILVAVSLVDNATDPKKSDYKLMWAQRKDINITTPASNN